MKKVDNLQREILQTLKYFAFFDYAPTSLEVYTFLRKKSTKTHLESILQKMSQGKGIKSVEFESPRSKGLLRYTLGGYTIKTQSYRKRKKISNKKLDRIWPYIRLLSKFPQIKLIGLSGSVGMSSAEELHDVDLFIITDSQRLFTGRIMALFLAQIFGIRRKRLTSSYKNSVCLNLFFDEKNLLIPGPKRSEYVAHEVLQMKPLVQKDDIYSKFIDINKWVFDIFPNARFLLKKPQFQTSMRSMERSLIGDLLEVFVKKLQLVIIKRHQTSEIVTETQLWFHPDDFEKKVKIDKRYGTKPETERKN